MLCCIKVEGIADIGGPVKGLSRKKQKTTQSVPSLSLNAPSPALHPQAVGGASVQPSSSSAKQWLLLEEPGARSLNQFLLRTFGGKERTPEFLDELVMVVR